MDKQRRNVLWLTCFLGGSLIGTAFGFYLWSLYGQLTEAFQQAEQFVPTRIYSDVTRLYTSAPRAWIEARLKSRGYTFATQGQNLQFTLHPMDYPTYLLPENHPTLDAKNALITLVFSRIEDQPVGPNNPLLLKSIRLGEKEVDSLYLEPELVATLSRGGEGKQEIRAPLKFEEIPSNVWKAIIAIEDQHFLEHKGLDPRGIARAIWVNLRTLSFSQGGSTITQQLVKNLLARHTKNLFRKINEVFLALLLEAKFEKEQILERYLNEVYLGQVGNLEIHGIAQGAEHFFGKKLEHLNLAETALMAGLIRGPAYYSPYRYRERALDRERLVLRKMVETGQIAKGEADAAMQLPIRLSPPQTSSTKSPYFTDYVKAEAIRVLKKNLTEQEIIHAGFRIYTTLDNHLNTLAQKSVSEGIQALQTRFNLPPQQRLEGALATVEHSSGFIRSLVGGRNYGQSNFNRILNMKRQIGSTFKPIVYLTAFAKGEDSHGIPYGPAYPVEDSPWTLTYDNGKQTWTPKNYEKDYRGWVSFRTALAHSINTVAAKLGQEVGLDQVIRTGHALGIEQDLLAVPSLALGITELSPIELLRVYSTLANRGVQQELSVIRGISQADGTIYLRPVYHAQSVFDPAAIDLTTSMLQSVFLEGTARSAAALGFHRPAAGKTGTTSNHRDAWFAGYTPDITTVVWVGMDFSTSDQEATPVNLTGANSALPIWVSFMKAALQGIPAQPFPPSPFLQEVKIDRHTGKLANSGCAPQNVLVDVYMKAHTPKDDSCEESWPKSK